MPPVESSDLVCALTDVDWSLGEKEKHTKGEQTMIELASRMETTLIRSKDSDVFVVSIDIDDILIAQLQAMLDGTPENRRAVANVAIDMQHILKVCQSKGLLLAVINNTKENDHVSGTE